jgi:hypothetical protein
MGASVIRLVAALLGAASIAGFDCSRYLSSGANAEGNGATALFWDSFWDSTTGQLMFVGILVAVGYAVGRWWAAATALTIVVSQLVLALFGVTPPDGVNVPAQLDPLSWVAGVLVFATPIAVGVGMRKLLGAVAASPLQRLSGRNSRPRPSGR